MPRWADNAEEQIEAEYAAGDISYGEYHNQLKDLRDDVRQAAHDAAETAYEDYYNN